MYTKRVSAAKVALVYITCYRDSDQVCVHSTRNSQSVVQIVLSTAHPAKSEAITRGLSTSQGFDSERHVLPQEFRGLLEKREESWM
jgi:hypothetical protein